MLQGSIPHKRQLHFFSYEYPLQSKTIFAVSRQILQNTNHVKIINFAGMVRTTFVTLWPFSFKWNVLHHVILTNRFSLVSQRFKLKKVRLYYQSVAVVYFQTLYSFTFRLLSLAVPDDPVLSRKHNFFDARNGSFQPFIVHNKTRD